MRYIIFILCLLVFTSAHADKLRVPFGCYPKEVQARFAECGLKLDLSGNDRTPDSWGFLVNEGSEYIIYTYYPIPREEFEVIFPLLTKIVTGGQNE